MQTFVKDATFEFIVWSTFLPWERGWKQCRRQRLPYMLTSSLSRSQLNYIVMQCTIKMHNDAMCFVLCRVSGRGLAQARRPKLSSKTCISVLSKAKFLDFSAQTVLARRLLWRWLQRTFPHQEERYGEIIYYLTFSFKVRPLTVIHWGEGE